MNREIYLLLGSSIGDRLKYLEEAKELIKSEIGRIEQESPVYETEPWGDIPQSYFYNQMIRISGQSGPKEILNKILLIEKKLGRTREVKWSDRTIDIDIIFFGNKIINDKDLTIPHPQFEKRNFAILPMMALSPDFLHPVSKKTIEDIYLHSTDDSEVFILDDEN